MQPPAEQATTPASTRCGDRLLPDVAVDMVTIGRLWRWKRALHLQVKQVHRYSSNLMTRTDHLAASFVNVEDSLTAASGDSVREQTHTHLLQAVEVTRASYEALRSNHEDRLYELEAVRDLSIDIVKCLYAERKLQTEELGRLHAQLDDLQEQARRLQRLM